jgi:hypothetical protein
MEWKLAYSKRRLNLVKSQNSQLVRIVGALYTLAETAGVWTGKTARNRADGQLCLSTIVTHLDILEKKNSTECGTKQEHGDLLEGSRLQSLETSRNQVARDSGKLQLSSLEQTRVSAALPSSNEYVSWNTHTLLAKTSARAALELFSTQASSPAPYFRRLASWPATWEEGVEAEPNQTSLGFDMPYWAGANVPESGMTAYDGMYYLNQSI